MRTLRFQPKKMVIASVTHSNSKWHRMGMRHLPDSVDEALALDFAERYTVQHSDIVLSPSQYMLDWLQEWGWQLPQEQHVLGLPSLPVQNDMPKTELLPISRLIFFGRIETRKGIELFIEAILQLFDTSPELFAAIQEIVILGKEGENRLGSPNVICQLLTDKTQILCRAITEYNSHDAQTFLQNHAADSLVIIPSLLDNFPYAVIECCQISSLRVIAAAVGGIPEILASTHTFHPSKQGLISTLRAWLSETITESPSYDWQGANQRWLAIHDQLKSRYQREIGSQQQSDTIARVTICIAHHNHGQYLAQLLQALALQTYQNMQVIVVDDGSDVASRQIFDAQAQQYQQSHGWQFHPLADNLGVAIARHRAVQFAGDTKYLIFVDADNVPLPQMVERYVEAIEQSQLDCLTCYFEAFQGEDMPYKLHKNGTIKRRYPVLYRYMPLGNDPVYSMMSNVLGDTQMIIRKAAYDEIGGFLLEETQRYTGYEDFALLVRLSLAGYALDVLPEVLFYYRHLANSLLRTTDAYQNMHNIHTIYRDHLRRVGMEGACTNGVGTASRRNRATQGRIFTLMPNGLKTIFLGIFCYRG
ncbi:MAG: glycosyltransferase [Anaerolineae bacterium]|nr:glycosyltransferase [Anaerolineae bacterium]